MRHGASPNKPDRIGQSPLISSLKGYDVICMKPLLEYGAKVNQADNRKRMALLSAMSYTDPVSAVIVVVEVVL